MTKDNLSLMGIEDIDKQAEDWEDDSLREIITDEKSEKKLDDSYDRFMSMHKQLRRESDWKSLELYGKTNEDRYRELKSRYLKQDFNTLISEEVVDEVPHKESLNITRSAIEAAKKYSVDSMRIIITPPNNLEELESMWAKYNGMHLKSRRESDWKAQELFKVNNKQLYEYYKSNLLKVKDSNKEIEDATINNISALDSRCDVAKDNSNLLEMAKAALKLANTKPTSLYENIIIKNTLIDSLELFKDNLAEKLDYETDDIPFYSPDEMMILGVFDGLNNRFGILPDNTELDDGLTSRLWFEHYKLYTMGVISKEFKEWSVLRVKKLNELMLGLEDIRKSNDITAINARMQSILELGWNPYLEFNPTNRKKASDRMSKILESMYSDDIIDITSVIENHKVYNQLYLYETVKDSKYEPMYIVFLKSHSMFNDIVKKITNRPYGHISVGFDPKLETLYSYNFKNNGFSIENINKYQDVIGISVFCTLVNKKDMFEVKKIIKQHMSNSKLSEYSGMNLFTIALNVDYNAGNFKMVCSQFVDTILKAAKINITKKSSSLVTPADIYNKSYRNKKFYKVYQGPVEKYDFKKVKSFVNGQIEKLNIFTEEFSYVQTEKEYIDAICENTDDISKIRYIDTYNNELTGIRSTVYNEMVKPLLFMEPIEEAKNFPVQFDDSGDLILDKSRPIDYRAEYSKSHKLIMAYSKANNREGIKQELCRLWYLNISIEEKMYGKNKVSKAEKQILIKIRANILNDFNKYLDIIMEKDHKFDFDRYYTESPYDERKVRIKSSTLKYTTRYIKNMLKI